MIDHVLLYRNFLRSSHNMVDIENHFKNGERKKDSEPPTLLEFCALCHEEFEMSDLIEKEVGDYGRVYCFCGGCIESLQREYRQRKEIGSSAEDEIINQEVQDTEN